MWRRCWSMTETSKLLTNTNSHPSGDSSLSLAVDQEEVDSGASQRRSTYGALASEVHLSPGHIHEDETSWWTKRKQRIFRKKTLFMRIPVLQWAPTYSKKDIVPDIVAGLTVGVTVIPQALAYAIIAGLPPEYGLYSSYIGCFVYVLLGSTRAVTIGPTALLALLTYKGASTMGPGAAIVLAFLTGSISFLFGILNLGFLVEFIAAPVIAGFTTAAALTIGTTQIKSLLGLKFESEGFVDTWHAVFDRIEETQPWDAVMGFTSVAVLLLLRTLDRINFGNDGNRTKQQRFLNSFLWLMSVSRNAIVMIVGAIIAASLTNSGQKTVPFEITGNITSGLPSVQLPPFYINFNNQTFNFFEICENLGSTLLVAPLIAILESVAIAKSFAKGQKVDASQEMIAIGLSNILGSFVSSYPVTGSFSRTAVNASSGVHTAVSGIYTGIMVLLAITVLTPYFYFIPISCLAAVIITAVIFMVEVYLVRLVWRSRKIDLIPLFVTFVMCLFISLEIGIVVGTSVNLAMLLYATARPRIKILKFQRGTPHLLFIPDRSLVFTSMEFFMSTVRKASALYPGLPVVIDLSYVSIADFSTAYGFDNLSEELNKKGHQVVITQAQPRVLSILLGVRPRIFVHHEGADLDMLLKEIVSATASCSSHKAELNVPSNHTEDDAPHVSISIDHL